MKPAAPRPSYPPRPSGPSGSLDIEAFPSDLSLMLLLLVVTVLAQDLFFALWMATLQAPVTELCTGPTLDCPRDAGAMVTGSVNYLLMLLTPGLVIGATTNWRRQRRSTPLAETPFHGAAEAVGSLIRQARLSRNPVVMVDRRLASGAYVTGQQRRPLLMLGPELLVLREKGDHGRRIFETVVRHELAHLRGRDLQTYHLLTVFRPSNLFAGAFIAFAMVLDVLNRNSTPGALVVTLLRAFLLTLLGELIARAYLRVREHHADLHAGMTDRDGLLAALGADSGRADGTGAARLRSWLRHHPLGDERLGVAKAPGRVLASSPGRVFLGATVAGVLLPTLQDMLLRFYGPESGAFTIIVCGVLVGLGLTLFVGFTLWRHQWYAAGPARLGRSALTGLIVAVGVVAGGWLALYTRVAGFGLTGMPLAPSFLAVLVVAAVLLCGWLSVVGAQWYRGDPEAQRMSRFLKLAVVPAALLGGWLMAGLWMWGVVLQDVLTACSTKVYRCVTNAPERDVAKAVTGFFGPGPVLMAVILIALGVPLAARFAAPVTDRISRGGRPPGRTG
ncbi:MULTISPECIES: M48 family metalloprotease [Streptomyces]|uniref:M48 family metalloprotease n=1 Tax=Streptomyces siderophoricus TaxID=2802281 RepID=A0ABS1MSK7_9ACTN|nr:M48 family metalloprotease [Streptomyces sp. 9-7]MBL1090729.1 M48 family metalloprotease [Streptomyces sp. 9-7]